MSLRRLDAKARAIVNLANDIAHEWDLEFVGTEHVLLAILRHNGSLGAQVLTKLGITEEKARARVDELVQRGKEDTWVFGRLPGSPFFQNVIERALTVADQLKAQSVSGEHLLLALFQDKESIASRTLTSLGVTLKKCRDAVLRETSATGAQER